MDDTIERGVRMGQAEFDENLAIRQTRSRMSRMLAKLSLNGKRTIKTYSLITSNIRSPEALELWIANCEAQLPQGSWDNSSANDHDALSVGRPCHPW